jgi:hypothetical protein
MELQTSKLNKNGPNRKVWFSFINFRWSLITFTLELLLRGLKIGQLVLTKIPICTKPFFVCSHLTNFRGLLSRVINLIHNQKVRDACLCLQDKENLLGNFVTKPLSQNHWKTKVLIVNICPELSLFYQRAKLWSIYIWIHQRP